MKKQLIIFTDIGDTVIDEGTETREVPGGVVLNARCIPGARESLLRLYEEGYTIVLVADGLEASFRNTMSQNGLEHIFSGWVVSERVGVEKPDAKMFQAAMESLGLRREDRRRIIMVGNNLSRDILGANRYGISSVQMYWSPRYPLHSSNPEEKPRYRIAEPGELPALCARLEARIEEEGSL